MPYDQLNLTVQVLPMLLRGATVTLTVALQAALLALAVSLVVGALRTSDRLWILIPTGVYVEFFRGTSAFVQIFWTYFALPMLGVNLTPLQAGIAVLGLNVGAYGSEVVRGALMAIPRGQIEACNALALPLWITYARVLIPQAMRRIVLPFGNLAIDLLKGTSLLSAITVTELAFAGRQSMAAFGSPLVVFSLVLVLYLAMTAPIAMATRKLNSYINHYSD